MAKRWWWSNGVVQNYSPFTRTNFEHEAIYIAKIVAYCPIAK
jgi:hypothetical protein